jgi:hypothetical protein
MGFLGIVLAYTALISPILGLFNRNRSRARTRLRVMVEQDHETTIRHPVNRL